MKNKIIVMLLTFIIMIFATPIVFKKMMNSKFDTMLLNLQQQKGVVIKEIKNKSSYLTTDRVFEVTIPGEAINQKEIDHIKLITEATFKNLPVTNVFFHNTLKEVVLKKHGEIPFLKDNIVFDVITPDFKHYKYKIVDKKIDLNKIEIGWSGFNGVYVYNKEFKNEDGNINISIKKNGTVILLKHFVTEYLKVGNKIEQNSGFKIIEIKSPKFNIKIDNINSQSETVFKKDVINTLSIFNVDNINVNGFVKINNLKLEAKINGLDKKAIEKLQQDNNKTSQESLKELIDKGFNGKLKLTVKNIFFMQPLGFVNAEVNFSIEKGNNFQKINKNDFSFLNLNAKIEASPQIGSLLAMSDPKIGTLIKNENNKSILIIKINKGKIFINGKEIKSH